MELYPLDARDIEAIARTRSNNTMPQKIKYWMYGGCGVFFAGIVYWVMSGGWKALGVMAVGAIVVWYSTTLSDKRRKIITADLKRAWRIERENQGANKHENNSR
jgi:Flp pilus assembly protein TadB